MEAEGCGITVVSMRNQHVRQYFLLDIQSIVCECAMAKDDLLS
jgi:hypothetical protein